ncbi:TetR/AcrR family transcriptional regulator [Blastococcus atacamensis]|uniref:TetR/AcrR family transcriptional regulator n=1 Tax=Blastococcus atacamensis TaxID=2070508 RepID=UPI000CEB8469|nr:TetR/AcrR family transcriptional regulator [Blastococcus atacamensis]
MPPPWTEMVAGHRSSTRDAVLDATAALVASHGLDLTMSQVAEAAGIGRATLYRHFPDLDAVLTAWHERQIGRHLQHLTAIRDRADDPADRLPAVLAAYAGMSRHGGQSETAARLHRSEHAARAHDQLRTFLAELIAEEARDGRVRGDVPPTELAVFVLGALSVTGELSSAAAVQRLVEVTLAGLRPGA